MTSKLGQEYRSKADKKATSAGGWSLFGAAKDRYEEVQELYERAGNQFKIDNCMKEAGDCFSLAGEMALKSGNVSDAANRFWTASKAYKRTHPELAAAALQRTIELCKSGGQFRQAADREKELATVLQQEGGDLNGALAAFERAGDLYSSEDATATANSCYKEAAELAASIGDYPRAVRHFELVAKHSLSSALTRYSVKEYYLKAALCWLATGDIVSTKRKLEEYCQQDPTFGSTREAKFIGDIADAVEGGDPEAFTAAVAEFDRLTRLDNWKTTLLLAIKRQIAEEPSLA